MNKNSAKISNLSINLGRSPYIEGEENFLDKKVRTIKYHVDRVAENFPLISHPRRIRDCLELNLFLIHRHLGLFSLKKKSTTETESYVWSSPGLDRRPADQLEIDSIEPIAKDLKIFLDWLAENNITYEESIAIPNDYDDKSLDDAEALLPVWRFRDFIEKRVDARQWSFLRGKRILANVRHYYIWLLKRSVIKQLPFDIRYEKLRVTHKSDATSLFAMPGVNNKKANNQISVVTSNLSLPRNKKQKSSSPNEGLQPYSPQELATLVNTKIYSHRTYGLFIRCALLAGLRAFEIIQIDVDDVIHPANRTLSSINLLRKFSKSVNLQISTTLMQMLWDYKANKVWQHRAKKFENIHGINETKPLFINDKGERMVVDSVVNTIALVRRELKAKSITLSRDFHDLRATFATYTAYSLLEKGYEPDYVRGRLLVLLSHENFETTQKYLDFAKLLSPSKHGPMQEYVEDLYARVIPNLSNENGGNLE
tara:strand:- start:919 stop:2364 length:1446 start_codon:yes stop_codon:yes gene_type:complete